MSSDNDKVTHPNHYALGRKHEPIEVIYGWRLDPFRANAVKYIARAGRKDDTKLDLQKAVFYLNFLIGKGVPKEVWKPEHDHPLINVLQDWGIGINLRRALVHIYDSRFVLNDSVFSTQCLKNAVSAIEDEIRGL